MTNEIETSLVETIRSSDLCDLTFVVADALMSPIPIFGSLSKLWGGVQSIHSYFYAKKVLAFLRELDSIPKEERQTQINRMLVDPASVLRVIALIHRRVRSSVTRPTRLMACSAA